MSGTAEARVVKFFMQAEYAIASLGKTDYPIVGVVRVT